MNSTVHEGRCFCGRVQFQVSGEPVAMGYCHCDSCRQWSAGPLNAFSLWKPEALRITQGADSIGSYHKTPNTYRGANREVATPAVLSHRAERDVRRPKTIRPRTIRPRTCIRSRSCIKSQSG